MIYGGTGGEGKGDSGEGDGEAGCGDLIYPHLSPGGEAATMVPYQGGAARGGGAPTFTSAPGMVCFYPYYGILDSSLHSGIHWITSSCSKQTGAKVSR